MSLERLPSGQGVVPSRHVGRQLVGDVEVRVAVHERADRDVGERQAVTELLVIVSPRIVEPVNQPPELPTGDPDAWDWDKSLRPPPADTLGAGGSR